MTNTFPGDPAIEIDTTIPGSRRFNRFDIMVRGRIISHAPIGEIRLLIDGHATSSAVWSPAEPTSGSVPGQSPDIQAFQFHIARPAGNRAEHLRFQLLASTGGGVQSTETFVLETDPISDQPVLVSGGSVRPDITSLGVLPRAILYIDRATIDSDGVLSVQGWSVSLDPILTVQVFAGAIAAGKARLRQERPDVAADYPAYPDAGLSGFSLTMLLPEALRHADRIRARVVCTNGFETDESVPVERLGPGHESRLDKLYQQIAPDTPPTRSRFGGLPYYDIERARQVRRVGGLALVFFMGLGDYLMATPVIEALHLTYPDLPIYAYASSTTDDVNSPLLVHLLRHNPNISATFVYRGRITTNWKNYDFRDALKDIPADFLILPVIYDVDPDVWHRVTSVTETFGLPVTLPVSPPVVPPTPLRKAGQAVLDQIRARLNERIRAGTDAPTDSADGSPNLALAGIVVCHFKARSSGYEYPYADQIVQGLIDRGYFVIAFSEANVQHPSLLTVDVSQIAPADTIAILRDLKASGQPLFMVSVNSVMWPISAAIGIPNLGIHVFFDVTIHQYLYSNIFVVTHHAYPKVSPCRLFLVTSAQDQVERRTAKGLVFTDYSPGFVLNAFTRMTELPR